MRPEPISRPSRALQLLARSVSPINGTASSTAGLPSGSARGEAPIKCPEGSSECEALAAVGRLAGVLSGVGTESAVGAGVAASHKGGRA